MASVSVIIVTFQCREFLRPMLDSLRAQTRLPDEIIVVDNASSDGSADLVAAEYPEVVLVRSSRNAGFASGCNAGYERANGDRIAFLNPDTVADPRWLEEMLRVIDADERAGAVVAKILMPDGRIDCVGGELNDLGFCWSRAHGRPDDGSWDGEQEVAVVTACAALVRREALGDEPPFDAAMFMYYEELDLSLRLRERGYSIVAAPRSVVHHRVSAAVAAVTDQPLLFKQFHGNQNRVRILAKHFPGLILIRKAPLIVASLVYWDTVFLLRGGPGWFLRAVRSQVSALIGGLRERRDGARAGAWVPWVQRHGLRDLWRIKNESGL